MLLHYGQIYWNCRIKKLHTDRNSLNEYFSPDQTIQMVCFGWYEK